jgi:hypothetical protein
MASLEVVNKHAADDMSVLEWNLLVLCSLLVNRFRNFEPFLNLWIAMILSYLLSLAILALFP